MKYQGKEYITRTGNHQIAGEVEFGTISLEKALMKPDYSDYKDEAARYDI